MPEIKHTGQLLNYADYRKYSNTFIETGTAAGDGVQRALDAGFSPIISVEAAAKWYEESNDRFIDNDNVGIYNLKSTEFLKENLSFITPDRVVFYLDAHPAGPLSAGHADWVANPNGDWAQDNIIQAELRIILAH